MKTLWQFILDGRFSEGVHNLMAAAGYVALIEVFVQDAHQHGLEVWKMVGFAAMVCGIPTAQALFTKWLRAPTDPAAPGGAP